MKKRTLTMSPMAARAHTVKFNVGHAPAKTIADLGTLGH